MKKIKIVKHKRISWYKLFQPTEKELNHLKEKFNFHPLDIEDCLEEVQRPKLDIYRSYVFLVLHLPKWNPNTQTLGRAELNVFLGPDFIIIVHDKKIPLLDTLFYQAKNSYQKRTRFFKNSSYYLFYFIFNQLLLSIKPITKQLGQIIKDLDSEILTGNYRHVLQQISVMRRNLILFQTIIKPQIPVLKRLEQGKAKIVNHTYAYYWGNLVDRLRSVWEELDDDIQLLEGLSTTNESLLSYRTNEVIKILTIFSVILLPLTLLSGIYGMNINTIPFLSSQYSFYIISLFMFIIAGVMLLFFKAKKWL
ncbi:magnesium transporter CorA family protein [Patescibacteria group bacterium]